MNDRRGVLWVLVILAAGCGRDAERSHELALEENLVDDMAPVTEEIVKASGGRGAWASGAATVLFVNFDGGAITKVSYKSDSIANQSFIGGGTIPPFNGDAAARAAVIAHLKTLYAAFNLKIVTSRPSSGDYDMAMVGGWPSSIGLPNGPSGVAPLDCGQKLPRDIAFIFSDVIQSSLQSSASSPLYHRYVAETIAHETGHAYGLPHSADGCDLMSYSSCAQPKKFLDKTMAMQSDSAGQCGFSSMNSYSLLLEALGPAPAPADTAPPAVAILAPAQGASLASPVALTATATDEVGVVRVEAREGGTVLASRTGAPYEFTLSLAPGAHTVTVHAVDAAGNEGSASVSFQVGASAPPPPPTVPPDSGVPPAATPDLGLPAPGTFGAPCAGPHDCQSGLCARAAGGGFCTQTCDDQTKLCPSGVTCQVATGGVTVCGKPAGAMDSMTGGCNLADGAIPRPTVLSLALAIFFLAFARRRA